MQSARDRKPSGRTNLDAYGGTLNMSPAQTHRPDPPASTGRSAQSRTARSSYESVIDTARARELNDPITVHRPYTPEVNQKAIERKPALPKSRYPTIPPEEPVPIQYSKGYPKWSMGPISDKKYGRMNTTLADGTTKTLYKRTDYEVNCRYKKPYVCTQKWLDENSKLTWFEAADFRTLLDHNNKREFARDFVERNRDRMWIYDRKYLNNKDHNDIVEEMIESPSFMMDMVRYSRTEKSLGIGQNSDKIYQTLDESKLEMLDEGRKSKKNVPLSNTKRPFLNTKVVGDRGKNDYLFVGMVKDESIVKTDPFKTSLTTSREQRDEQISRMLLPATAQMRSEDQSANRRGYCHDLTFGNFSRWNGVLKNSGIM